MRSSIKIYILYFITILAIGILFFIPPISQWQSYHVFADQDMIFGISNFWNVITNAFVLIVGILGVVFLRFHPIKAKIKQVVLFVFFISVILIALGSAYYHLNPNDSTLMLDRIPIAVAFMAILSFIIIERVSRKVGSYLFFPLILFGIFSVIFWNLTGDLRLYGFVQFLSLLLMFSILLLFRSKYTLSKNYFIAIVLYLLAHISEMFDKQIYILFRFGGGASLKHIFSAIAVLYLLLMFQKRKLISKK